VTIDQHAKCEHVSKWLALQMNTPSPQQSPGVAESVAHPPHAFASSPGHTVDFPSAEQTVLSVPHVPHGAPGGDATGSLHVVASVPLQA
jgi:hypothetical protein